MAGLAEIFKERILTGLRRKAIHSCSKWAQAYRIMGAPIPGPYGFSYHPWIEEVHDDPAESLVARKGAQLGFTDFALNRCLYAIDMLGDSVLYILPSAHPDANDFSTSRFDPAIELSDHLSKLFSDVKNIGHKRAGSANLYIRGSRSKSQLKSIPVSLVIFDELDEMVQENIALALERMSGQPQKKAVYISTPTIENYGIDELYKQSDEKHYFFKCPHCSKWTELIFPECLVITAEAFNDTRINDSHYICKECHHKLDHNNKKDWVNSSNCRWVPTYTNRTVSGYTISQLYSFMISPVQVATWALQAVYDPTVEQELYNSKLGMPHTVKGAKINDTDIKNCLGSYVCGPQEGFITAGIDVGTQLHVVIDHWEFDTSASLVDINLAAKPRTVGIFTVTDFAVLIEKLRENNVYYACIDANPERRAAIQFAQQFGRATLIYYDTNINGKEISTKDDDLLASVNRTSWLDLTLGRYRTKTTVLPMDTPHDYKQHIKALTRIYDKDQFGNPVGRYVSGNLPDHYAHARNYSEIAFKLGAKIQLNTDIASPI